MKALYTILVTTFISLSIFAQVPEKINYQAIVRNSTGDLVRNKQVRMRISIYQNSDTETPVYSETHVIETDENGLVSLIIGDGTTTDVFSSIDWSNGVYNIKTETDTDGESDFTISGFSQILSVPYSLCAKTVENDMVDDADADATNELQALSISGSELTISNGNTVSLPTGTGSLWQTSDNNLIYKAGKVGIDTAVPSASLHVAGNEGVLFEGEYGNGTIPSEGTGARMMWYPAKAAFRSGYVNTKAWNDSIIGLYSVAMGVNTIASGGYSTAMGQQTTASGAYSTAFGAYTKATNYYSIALGKGSIAIGEGSIALGGYTEADGNYATAMGFYTKASGDYSIAMGNNTTSSGLYSLACGDLSVAKGVGSITLGYSTTASGVFAIAIGEFTTASGDNSTAMGASTTSSGNYSSALGYGSTASGAVSIAMGDHTNANGNNSTTIGIQTTANGIGSIAMGTGTVANSFASTAIGVNNIGGGTPDTWFSSDPIFEIGNSQYGKGNAMTVLKNGNAGIGTGIVLDENTRLTVEGDTNDYSLIKINQNGTKEYAGLTLHRDDTEKWFMGMDRTTDNLQFRNAASTNYMTITEAGNVGIGTTTPAGKLDVNGAIYQRGGSLHADYVFENDYSLETIEEHAAFMWQNKHLPAIPKATTDNNGDEIVEVGAHRKGIVEELEKAHIYISQLENTLQNQSTLIKDQEVRLELLEQLVKSLAKE